MIDNNLTAEEIVNLITEIAEGYYSLATAVMDLEIMADEVLNEVKPEEAYNELRDSLITQMFLTANDIGNKIVKLENLNDSRVMSVLKKAVHEKTESKEHYVLTAYMILDKAQ